LAVDSIAKNRQNSQHNDPESHTVITENDMTTAYWLERYRLHEDECGACPWRKSTDKQNTAKFWPNQRTMNLTNISISKTTLSSNSGMPKASLRNSID